MSTTDIRAAFEKRFGPNDSFAWRDENGNYKVAALQHAWEVWQAATEAAKVTGTAVELPKLPKPVGAVEHCPSKREIKIEAAFTADQMREYGQACTEAARQPAPATLPPVVGVSRDADSPGMTGVLVTFARPLIDGQLRELHEYLNRSQP